MKSKHLARFVGLVVGVSAAIALVAPFAQASTPAPGYERFTGCPSPAENPVIAGCVYSVVTGGHFQMGNKDVPITNPITLTGGVEEGLTGFTYNSQGGLKPVKQKVPGGVIGLTGLTWLAEVLGTDALTLYAVTELAGQPQIHGLEEIVLPVKVHLINPVLGNKCYVGSSSSPINLHLITGTTNPPAPNQPITGQAPEGSFNTETNVIVLANGKYVDNSFAAPGASGCVLTLLGILPISINGLVNTQSGLPSPAGTNETIQILDTELASSELVYP
jgi:hypothetical protein